MEESKAQYSLKCAFCGKNNEFPKEELYLSGNENQIINKKFCLQCGEFLVKFCPICETAIFILENLKEYQFFQIDNSFDEPTPSPLDLIIPNLKKDIQTYQDKAILLNVDLFRTKQPNFINTVKEIVNFLPNIYEKLEEISSSKSRLQIEKHLSSLRKKLDKNVDKCKKVLDSIVPNKEYVNDKMHKKLYDKGLDVFDWKDEFNELISTVESFRKNEIKEEINSYQPGKNRIKKYLLYNPNNYTLTCPTCKTKIYSIEKRDFIFGESKNSEVFNLNELLGDQKVSPQKKFSNTYSFKVSINISKPGGESIIINAPMRFVLNDGEELIIGRNYIRELMWNEPISDEILFDDEKDILGMVSRTQITLFKENNELKIRGKEFDERLIGTFLNDLKTDIRKEFPKGKHIKKSDKIIIPITNEEDNSNIIELEME